jgi:preprotein translocase subunit SecF
LDFVGRRGLFFLISLAVILSGVAFLIIAPGLKPGIDFTGGSSMIVSFSDDVDQEALRIELAVLGHPDARVQTLDEEFLIHTKELSETEKNDLLDSVASVLSPGGFENLSFDLVSPLVAGETIRNAFWAVLAAAVGVFLYIWWAFRNVPSPLRYGAGAVIALIHDTVIVVGIFAILGEVAGVEVNTMFLIALLTVIGYSVNDTIVVFDRLRENILSFPNRTLAENVNVSISETIGRSLNTSLTLLFTLMALILFGGSTIREFLLVLLIGVAVGTYSSIAIASQTLVVWEHGDIRRLVRRGRVAR